MSAQQSRVTDEKCNHWAAELLAKAGAATSEVSGLLPASCCPGQAQCVVWTLQPPFLSPALFTPLVSCCDRPVWPLSTAARSPAVPLSSSSTRQPAARDLGSDRPLLFFPLTACNQPPNRLLNIFLICLLSPWPHCHRHLPQEAIVLEGSGESQNREPAGLLKETFPICLFGGPISHGTPGPPRVTL